MMTFAEAIETTILAKTPEDATAKGKRQTEFIAEMMANELYMYQMDRFVCLALDDMAGVVRQIGADIAANVEPDVCEDSAAAKRLAAAIYCAVHSAFLNGMNVGRAMEAQDVERLANA